MEVFSWKANEHEQIHPFKTSAKGLDNCTYTLDPSKPPNSFRTEYISTDDFWTKFCFLLWINVDVEVLANDTGLESNEIVISVIIRDRTLSKFAMVYQSKLMSLPSTPIDLSEHFTKFSQSKRMDVSVIASPLSINKVHDESIANHKSHVVASNTLKLRRENKSPSFPYRWVSSDEFVKMNAPDDTVWLINWLREDMDNDPSDIIEVLVNDNRKDKFKSIELDKDPSTKIILYEMAAAILTEISLKIFSDSRELPTESSGLRRMIFDELSEVSGLSIEEIFKLKEKPNFSGIVHAWVQKKVGFNRFFV